MSLVRPGASHTLRRWREVLVALGLAALGLWWALTGFGLLAWIGWAMIVAAAALGLAGVQRVRFRRGAGGPGVVVVDEGLIAYLGPVTGGAVALSEITALALDPDGPHWVLRQPGQPALRIPLDAEGAEALFDAFAALPGLRTEHMLARMRRPGPVSEILWQRHMHPTSYPRLH
ncbi:MAG: hypothetical protein CVT70_09110 [Alphaproteobacteria bacterium HGW-Alphaproteobacteria-1]|jgi:hypothetical protein|nr:MAG: hypothetical protein CVT70_09110 [Alphaproteobacteria bacterium HGW-Alphaproteobacteria-1]